MKNIITVFLVLTIHFAQAQQKDTVSFFIDGMDQTVDPRLATYLRIGIRQDTLWQVYDLYLHKNKIRMKGWSKDDSLHIKHGPHEYYSKEGNLTEKGIYLNGKRQGLWKQFSETGSTFDSVVYKHGIPVGLSLGYYENGTVSWKRAFDTDGNGNGTLVHYYRNGSVRDSGTYNNNQRTGVWIFFREDKSKASEITFEKDSAIASNNYDAKGKLIASKLIEQEATYPGGDEAWNKYLGTVIGKLYDKKDYLTYVGSCMIQFIVEKDGSIQYCEIVESSNDKLAEYVMSMIPKSKKWNAAVQYNLPVKAWRRQRFTFYITD
ncbi:MAG TPA: energy transducer TonB [Lacibacter sp.]|nr:energy transducer TonB [Lacibacter sp.]